jgi:hypothetical protein
MKANRLWALFFFVFLFVVVVKRSRPEFFGALEVMRDMAPPRPRGHPMSDFFQDDETTVSTNNFAVDGAQFVISNNTMLHR